jgi:protein ImuB
MFACLYLPLPVNSAAGRAERREQRDRKAGVAVQDPPYTATLVQLARDFSPRIETHGDRTVTLDISGLGNLIGDPGAIGAELRRASADAGLRIHIAVASTSTAAILLAQARAGLTVVAVGTEAATLAPLPLRTLTQLGFGLRASNSGPGAGSLEPEVEQLSRWGLRTLGDLAALPSADLSARLGQEGLRWQRWARGEEARPLVPAVATEAFEASLDLEWPIDELEPLSFVLARLFEPLCDRLEREDRGVVTLHTRLKLVTRDLHERSVELPAPMRDARVLRTLALLDLESNPPPAAIDRVMVGVDVTEARVLQFGLFARALPTDKLATLMARLGALMGSDRVGAPSLVDTYRPGAFTMAKFDPPRIPNPKSLIPNPRLCATDACALRRGSPEPSAEAARAPASVLRRFRSPIVARVMVEQGRPTRVTTDRRGFIGGRVERREGPWRSSGDWWKHGWNCDEWDVVLSDGSRYRISQAHEAGVWSVDGMLD